MMRSLNSRRLQRTKSSTSPQSIQDAFVRRFVAGLRFFVRRDGGAIFCIVLLFAGCNTGAASTIPAPPPAETQQISSPTPISTAIPARTTASPQPLGLTHLRPDGNRLLNGQGNLPDSTVVDIDLGGIPLWLVAAAESDGGVWVVALEDGRIQSYRSQGGHVSAISMSPEQLPAGMPPVLVVSETGARLLDPPEDASIHSAPLPLGGERVVYVDMDGELVFRGPDGEYARFGLDALPDARILRDDEERILLLSGATVERYTHGVLGDRLEAASITLLESWPEPAIVTQIELPAPQVVEGIAPIWTDLTGDGVREILVTISDDEVGARLVVYSETGERLFLGPAIGQGQRWRHQIAVAPFGSDGTVTIASIITPHIGGLIEFFEPVENRLSFRGSHPGYSSHALGSRNLDMGLAGDLDGDGRIELLVPNQRRNELGAARLDEDGVNIVWTLPLGGQLTTNLTGISGEDGIAIGAGRADGTLRLWLPDAER